MSGEAVGWAFRKIKLSDPTTKYVLVALANYADIEDKAWPKLRDMVRITGLSRRTIQNSLKKLSDLGIIKRLEQRRADGSQMQHVVYLDLEFTYEDLALEQDENDGSDEGEADAPDGAGDAPPPVQMATQGGATDAPLKTTITPQVKTTGKLVRTGHVGEAAANQFFAERFWPNYPKREGTNPKEPARKKFVQLVTGGENPEKILDGLRNYVRALRARNDIGTKFVKQAMTWLSQRGYDDDPEAAPAHQVQPNGGGGGFFAAAAQIRRNAGE